MLKFKTPRDYNSQTGLMQMTTDQTFIQGLYRVISCESIFENGQFTQQLAMIRVQNQVSNDPGNIPNITKELPNKKSISKKQTDDVGQSIGIDAFGGEGQTVVPGIGLVERNRQPPLPDASVRETINNSGDYMTPIYPRAPEDQ